MAKNIIMYVLVLISSIFSVYMLSDKILQPYFLYIEEITIPNILNQNF